MDDRIDFKKSGVVVITFDDQTITLRRPKAGELLDLRTKLLDISDQRKELTQLNQTIVEDIDPSLSEEDQAAAAKERREAVKKLQTSEVQRDTLQWDFDEYGGWLTDMIELLSGEKLVAADLPAWLLEGELLNRFLAQWRSVPLAPGN